ncbi:MAG: sodium-dependent transporter [Gammaproteobacteria bacterium]|nr:sodium-dependent transporter [Gammaproteobacteria bacterium]
MTERTNHEEWSSRWTFVLAAAGSAIGLGNIWVFPYAAGKNGGGAFLLVYLLCLAVMTVPIMMAALMLGRRGRQSPINTMRLLSREEKKHPAWEILGWSCVLAGFIALSYYSVLAGWMMAYVPRVAYGMFSGIPAEQIGAEFARLTNDSERIIAWHTLFMLMTMLAVGQGVRNGVEWVIHFIVPALFVLLAVLLAYAMTTGKFPDGVYFLFNADFSRLFYPDCRGPSTLDCTFSIEGVLTAASQAFFALSLGTGAIMMYGAYLPKNVSIPTASIMVAGADTLAAILTALIIFPIMFAAQQSLAEGPRLIFTVLPLVFGELPGGALFGTLFFIMLMFAAWSSAISFLEPAVAWLMEKHGITRVRAVIWCGSLAWGLGLLTVFSFTIWKNFKPLAGRSFYSLAYDLTTYFMLPLGGLFIAVFAGWMLRDSVRRDELGMQGTDIRYKIWLIMIRYVAPIGVITVFLNAIGVF